MKVAKVTLDDIMTLIHKWVEDNDGNVCFYGDFVQFDPTKADASVDEHIPDSRLICFGDKETLEIMVEEFNKMFEEEEEDFINW